MIKFDVEFLEEADEYLSSIPPDAAEKLIYNIRKSREVNDDSIFKKIDADVWEFKAKVQKQQYRLFAFWDKSKPGKTLVIGTHGIIKKTQKTPRKEIKKTIKLMKEYFDNT